MATLAASRPQTSIPWGRATVLLVFWSFLLAGLYSETWRAWNGEPPLELLSIYPHGPSLKSIALFFLFLGFLVLCVLDLIAMVAAVAKKRRIPNWRWVTGALFIAGLGLAAIPADFIFAATIRAWGPSKNARIDLHNAAAMGRVNTVEAFLRQGASQVLDSDSRTLLHVAAEHGKIKVIDIVIARGAEIDAQDSRGRTPLHRAVQNDQVDAVRHLLAKGANNNAVDISGNTPEQLARTSGRDDIVRVLMRQ